MAKILSSGGSVALCPGGVQARDQPLLSITISTIMGVWLDKGYRRLNHIISSPSDMRAAGMLAHEAQ